MKIKKKVKINQQRSTRLQMKRKNKYEKYVLAPLRPLKIQKNSRNREFLNHYVHGTITIRERLERFDALDLHEFRYALTSVRLEQ